MDTPNIILSMLPSALTQAGNKKARENYREILQWSCLRHHQATIINNVKYQNNLYSAAAKSLHIL